MAYPDEREEKGCSAADCKRIGYFIYTLDRDAPKDGLPLGQRT